MRKFIWLFKAFIILGLATVIFGSSGWFAYQLFIKPNIVPPDEMVVGATKAPPDPSLPDFQKAMDLKKQGKLVEARTALETMMENYPYSTKLAEARDALGKINSDIFFSAIPAPEKIRYEIRPGDALVKIERKLKTNRELIMRCNNLDDPTRLRIGTILFVTQPNFSVIVNRKDHTVTLLNNYKFFRQYHATTWNAPVPKKSQEKVAITGKVTEKIAWKNGVRVNFGSKDYLDSDRWVELSVRGFTFYTDGGQKPPAGIGFAPEDMEELSTLLSKNVPVSIQ